MLAIALTATTQAPHGVGALSGLDPATQAIAHPMGAFLALALGPGLLILAYSRIPPAQAGENPVRRALLEAFAAGGCHSASELARLVGVSRKTIAYHLRVLERAGLVARRGGATRPYFVGAGQGVQGPAAWVLRNANRRAVWEHARARPGVSVPELARGLGMKPGTVYFHVRVLAGAGLLGMVEQHGARVVVAPEAPASASAAPSAPEAPPVQA